MKNLTFAAVLAFGATTAFAAEAPAERFVLDSSHSQVVFNYEHLGFSTTYGMFSGFEGEIMYDAKAPANSSVSVSMPVMSMFTGWEQREAHFMSGDFPMAGKPWLGFDATTTLTRSDFNLGAFAPAVSDEVNVMISLEAMKAD